jgi:hypothetical protein
MSGNPTVGIDVVARLDALRADLAKIPEVGGAAAKQLTAELSKQIKQAEKAAKDAAKGAKEAKEGFGAVGDSAGKAGQASAKLAGALSLISPAAGDAARNVNDLADVFEVAAELGASTGVSAAAAGVGVAALTEVVAAGYLAWKAYNEEDERAARIAAEVSAQEAKLAGILDSSREAAVRLKVATGELTEAEGARMEVGIRAQKAYQDATADTRKRLAELRDQQGSFGQQIVDDYVTAAKAVAGAVGYTKPFAAAIDGLTTDSSELQQEIDGLQGSLDDATRVTRENVDVTNKAAEADKAAKGAKEQHRKAVDDLRDRLRELSAVQQASASDAASDLATYEQADAKLIDMGDNVANAQLSASDKVRLALKQQLDEAAALRDKALAKVQQGSTAAETIEQDYQRTRVQLEQAADADIAKLRDKDDADAEEKTRQAIARAKEQARAEGAAFGNLFGNLSDLASTSAEAIGEKNKAGAQSMFAIGQGFAAAQAAINTALAISAANTIPFPGNIPAIAAAAAQGIAEEISIANAKPPSFGDTPGPVQVDGSDVNYVGFKRKDIVIAAQRPEDVVRQAANLVHDEQPSRRAPVAPDPFTGAQAREGTVIKLQHRAFHASLRQSLQRKGPLADAVRGTQTIGHRVRNGG